MAHAVDGHWSCSRCGSFGSIRPGEEQHCECDEYEHTLRSQLSDVRAALVDACDLAEKLRVGDDEEDDINMECIVCGHDMIGREHARSGCNSNPRDRIEALRKVGQ
jgi:hypothetical protein